MKTVAMILKAIHAQESKEATREKACSVSDRLKEMKLSSAAKKVQDGIEETLTYMDFPTQHWTRIRINNTMERLNREIKLDHLSEPEEELLSDIIIGRLSDAERQVFSLRKILNTAQITK